jgi:hypothetical protein
MSAGDGHLPFSPPFLRSRSPEKSQRWRCDAWPPDRPAVDLDNLEQGIGRFELRAASSICHARISGAANG